MNDEKLERLKKIMMNATPHEDIRAEVEGLFLYLEQLEIFVECCSKDFKEKGE